MCVVRFTEDGIVEWSQEFSSEHGLRASSAVVSDEDEIYIAGTAFGTGLERAELLLQLTGSGTLTWAREVPGTGSRHFSQALLFNGDVLALGNRPVNGNVDMSLARFDTDGNLIDYSTMGSSGNDGMRNAVPLNDGLVILGYKDALSPILLFTDSDLALDTAWIAVETGGYQMNPSLLEVDGNRPRFGGQYALGPAYGAFLHDVYLDWTLPLHSDGFVIAAPETYGTQTMLLSLRNGTVFSPSTGSLLSRASLTGEGFMACEELPSLNIDWSGVAGFLQQTPTLGPLVELEITATALGPWSPMVVASEYCSGLTTAVQPGIEGTVLLTHPNPVQAMSTLVVEGGVPPFEVRDARGVLCSAHHSSRFAIQAPGLYSIRCSDGRALRVLVQ